MTEKQIQKNIEIVEKLIDKYVVSDRKTKILEMLKKYGDFYYTAPASTKTSFHSAFPGGLLHHTLEVCKNLFKFAETIAPEIDKESLLIVGLFHDIGKACTTSLQPVYIWNESEWHREKLGKIYELNPDIRDGLTHAQRSLRLITESGIDLTDDEFQAILFHDGQYLEENKSISLKESKLLFLLHISDYYTYHFENDNNK